MPNLELTTQTQRINFINYNLDENGKMISADSIEVNNVSVSNFFFESLSQDSDKEVEGFVTKCTINNNVVPATFESSNNHIWFITPILESESVLSVDYYNLTTYWYTTYINEDDNVTNPLYVSNGNICVYPNTIIQTDQGNFCIDELSIHKHTIDNQKIIHIVRSHARARGVVRIEKDALGGNIPDKCTHMSGNHVVKYNGNFVEAKRLIHLVPSGVSLIYNSKSILYNILLDEYTFINANNMIIETLHPLNAVAKIYNNKKSQIHKKIQ